jgi:hypothetical protein
VIRDRKVMLDADLARLYGVETRRLNEQVRRNPDRFPAEFMFQTTNQEVTRLMSQFATSKLGRGGTRKPPLAFTEHGAIMAATVLNSPRRPYRRRSAASASFRTDPAVAHPSAVSSRPASRATR